LNRDENITHVTLLTVTPLFDPATGGASTYYGLLVEHLIDAGIVERVIILTGSVEGAPSTETRHDGRLLIRRLFPSTATSDPGLLQYGRYALQNLLYATLPAIIRRGEVDAVLAHSSFHNFPNTFSLAIRRISSRMNCRLIADVRDCLLPERRLGQLETYDRIIACSRNIEEHLSRAGKLAPKITHIPVLQEPISAPSDEEVEAFRETYDLPDVPYVSYVGLIKKKKGVDLLLEAHERWVDRGREIHLVLAGQMKARPDLRHAIDTSSHVQHVGVISRDEVFALQAGAGLSVNLSPSEGMPRSCLEAIGLNVPVVLPSGVPEFERWCPDHVIADRDPETVSRQLQEVFEVSKTAPYPLERHRPEAVVKKYDILINQKG
jgi:glycosyltransferase involved in cell wall biosynthesis